MSRFGTARPLGRAPAAWAVGLLLSALTPACGTEAPMPLPKPVPVEPDDPVPPSRLKFDVGAIPKPSGALDPDLAEALSERLARENATGTPLRSWTTLQAFYAQRQQRPAWIAGRQISAVAVDALRGLGRLPVHGLDPVRYGTDALAPSGPEPEDPVGFELLLTDAWLTAATHLGQGRIDPATMKVTWSADGRADPLIPVLETALAEGNPRDTLLAQAPTHAAYVARVEALEALLAQAKKAKVDETLLAQLSADLERLRWLPRELEERHLWLDRGAETLTLVSGRETGPRTRVAVSKRCRRVDARSTTITEVVVHPANESRGAYELRTADAGVVLHGAPEGEPFPDDGAARSGCVRLQVTDALAIALLRGDSTYDRAQGDPAPDGPEQVVTLAEPVPLHVTRTSVDVDGSAPALRKEADADAALRGALNEGPPPVRSLGGGAATPKKAPKNGQ